MSNARVIFGSANRILIPDYSIVKQQGSGVKTVFVLEEDSTVSVRVIELGRHLGGNYEVLSGLKEGETIVISGHGALRSGTKVNVIQ